RGIASERTAFFTALTLLGQPDARGPGPVGADPEVTRQLQAAGARLDAAGVDRLSEPVEARYDWIREVCEAAARQEEPPVSWTDRVDRVATHRVGGFLVFFLLMGLMFQAIFSWAELPMGWIEAALGGIGAWAAERIPEGDFQSLVVDGVIAGVGGVLVFLPQIVFLFLFIGLLEDSGYMARAAFVMDRVMSRVGLHGKSFIPLLSSFACAIPGILAARTIENRRDRMITILVAPLMSCSARLPVYTVLIAGFIPAERLGGFVSLPALVLVSMYLLGLGAALGMASVFKRTLFRGETPLFLMELPPYKLPAMRTVLLQTWQRSSEFLKRAGTVILAINVLLWFAMRFPGQAGQPAGERLRNSVAGHAGRLLEPAIQPFGMDWKVGIGILGSFAAREVFVSTMATVYNVDDADEEKQSLSVRQQMQEERDPVTGKPRFTALSALALLVFYVFAMQCVSTLATVHRETEHWRWPLFQWIYMCVLAWGGATLVYQVGRALGLA
ncbi:MAG: ferrous iron transport protein B, partial [Armatimonadetes bacterium]|nr:ferrous iron transport protein B [Armatimonadota bacterium]